jgi:prevent-host-death family protein
MSGKVSSGEESEMKIVNMREARVRLTDLVNEVNDSGERIVIGRRNKKMAALIPVDEAEWLEKKEDEADLKAARRALQKGGKPIPWEKLKKDLGLR